MDWALELKHVSKRFGETEVLCDIDLKVTMGEFLVFVGPSGCGKSTLLRLISGLEELTGGEIYIHGREVSRVEPRNRDLAMVFQNYALYPHLSVYDNMAFGLRMRKIDPTEIKRRVEEAAEILGLEFFLKRRPRQLSGGQRQRVALGRAIVRRPKLFLFDEPLSNLDAKLRNQMRVEIKKLHQLLGNTMIYVTHDQVEATTLGNRIAVFEGGKIQQIDTPEKLYAHPSNLFVAGFIGMPEMNLVHGNLESKGDHTDFVFSGGRLSLPARLEGGPVVLGIRPEHLKPVTDVDPASFEGQTLIAENLGGQKLLHLQTGENIWTALVEPSFPSPIGQKVRLRLDLQNVHFFNPETGLRRASV